MSGATLRISKKNLLHNIKTIKHYAPHSEIYAVVKANAYGSDIDYVCEVLAEQVQGFAVARIDEAVQIWRKNHSLNVLLLEGVFTKEQLEIALNCQFHLVIHSLYQLEMLESWAGESKKVSIDCWIKVETGMHRLGFATYDVSMVFARLMRLSFINKIGLLSHLYSGENLGDGKASQQIEIFKQLSKKFYAPLSMSASNGILHWQDAHFEMIRPGIILHGVSPDKQDMRKLGFLPTLVLQAPLIAINQLAKGECVGYGGTWQAPEDTTVGILAIGYADGYPRVPSGTRVFLNGRFVTTIGRVSMDMTAVDLGKGTGDCIGDLAELWGEHLAIEYVAEQANTFAYELMTHINRRVRIIYDESS